MARGVCDVECALCILEWAILVPEASWDFPFKSSYDCCRDRI